MGLFDRGRGQWPLNDGAAPPAAPPERCDRCGHQATYRFGKAGVVVIDEHGAEVKDLDLLLCRGHGTMHAPALRLQGFFPLQVMS